jgi:hypothetical protein
VVPEIAVGSPEELVARVAEVADLGVGVPCHGHEGQDPHGRGEAGVAVHCGSVASVSAAGYQCLCILGMWKIVTSCKGFRG